MTVHADTSHEAHAVQLGFYRALSPGRRLQLGLAMAEDGRELARAGIRARHPDYSAEQVEDAVKVMYLGADVFREVWPSREVVLP